MLDKNSKRNFQLFLFIQDSALSQTIPKSYYNSTPCYLNSRLQKNFFVKEKNRQILSRVQTNSNASMSIKNVSLPL